MVVSFLCWFGFCLFILSIYFSVVFFSCESFPRFHCAGTLSTCLGFEFLLLNGIKRESVREQSWVPRLGRCDLAKLSSPAALWYPRELAMPKITRGPVSWFP